MARHPCDIAVESMKIGIGLSFFRILKPIIELRFPCPRDFGQATTATTASSALKISPPD